jgi:hypothetical protein
MKTSTTDAFPNYLSGQITQTGTNVFTSLSVALPLPRFRTAGRRATIIELLWVEASAIPVTVNLDGNATVISFGMNLAGAPAEFIRVSDPLCIFSWELEGHFSGAAGAAIAQSQFKKNLQSAEGFGYLVAADSVHVYVNSNNQAVANTWDFRIYYRFVDVPVEEFIGIVQSQQ